LMGTHILAEQYGGHHGSWYTTADAARALQVTPRSVRRFAEAGQLPCETTPSGQHLFRPSAVVYLGDQRLRKRLRGVTALRPKKVSPRGGPRQLSLFGARLRLVSACGHTIDANRPEEP
jgi:hypothetical protein